GRPQVDHDVVNDISELLRAVAPLIADVAGRVIPPDRVYFACGSAVALLKNDDDGFHIDRALHVGLLVSELRAFLCRRELDRRGDPLTRAFIAQNAWETPVASSALLH